MSLPDANAAAVAQLMESLGVTLDDLTRNTTAATGSPVPTVAEFHALVVSLATNGLLRTYGNHWRALKETYGERRLDSLRKSELELIVRQAQLSAKRRANSRPGSTGAAENAVAALRHFFERAVDDRWLSENPAAGIRKPKRHASGRRPLKPEEVAQLWEVTSTTGNDPELDLLLFRFHLETGARRGGALALRLRDLDHERQTVRLEEKGNTVRLTPISRTLLDALVAHATSRRASATDGTELVFRYKPLRGETRPLTYRRYDNLCSRWQSALPWADKAHVSVHWLRHTAIAEVEKLAGFGAARKFAGHTDESAATTLTYIRADDEVVAAAHVLRTGEPHPLAPNALPQSSGGDA